MKATEEQIKTFNSLKKGDIVYPITTDGFWSLVQGVTKARVVLLLREDLTAHVEILDGEKKGTQYALFADEINATKHYYDPHSWMDIWGE